MDLSIIIVNWKSKDYLRSCLASVVAETRRTQYEIIVIDSASYDGCDQMLREHFPYVKFIQSHENVGFAKANNRAFMAATGDYVLFLNPDTELLGPAIDTLYLGMLSLKEVGLVGAKLLNSDRSLQTSCIQSIPTILNQVLDSEFLRARWPCSSLWGMAPLFRESPSPQEVEAISGACVMVKRSVFEQVGRFSEDYFMYCEDIDLSQKVRQAGYKNHYVATATVVHHGGSSVQQAASNFSIVVTCESAWRFFRKTRGNAYGFGYRVALLITSLLRLGVLVIAWPFQQIQRRSSQWQASVGKWRGILRWSLHLESWATRL